MSDRQVMANQANALKSTGPRTVGGKAVSSQNASRHGIFSNSLLLEHEIADDFDNLQLELQRSLHPIGLAELALVERIAINMWRQRRLVAAESATLRLNRSPEKIAQSLSDELGRTYSSNAITEEHLKPYDNDQEKWCRDVIGEIEALDEIVADSIEQHAPLTFAQLKTDAKEDNSDLDSYLDDRDGGLSSYVAALMQWCQTEIEAAERQPKLIELSRQIEARKLVLPQRELDLLARYQTTLDNQLYKSLKALREAQEWRLKTIDIITTQTPPEPANSN